MDEKRQVIYLYDIMKSLLLIFVLMITSAMSQTIEIFELQKRCMIEGKKYFQERKKEITTINGVEDVKLEHHFNKKKSICLLRVKRNSINSTNFIGDSIYSVLENKTLMLLYVNYDEKNKVFTCVKNENSSCFNEQEYKLEAEKLMSE